MTERRHEPQTLAQAVVALRRDREMTQAELAAKAGIAHRTVQHIEAGTRRPFPAILAAVERALEVDEGELQRIIDGEPAQVTS